METIIVSTNVKLVTLECHSCHIVTTRTVLLFEGGMMNGILFKPDMIQAIKEGRKTVTRRLQGLEAINQEPDKWMCLGTDGTYWGFEQFAPDPEEYHANIKPRYHIGETVYIREAWCVDKDLDNLKPTQLDDPRRYFRDDPLLRYGHGGRWRSPLHLPARFARYFIKIKDNKPGRLQEITLDDCLKEGFGGFNNDLILAKVQFINKWNSINPAMPFNGNYWVWRYEFTLTEKHEEATKE